MSTRAPNPHQSNAMYARTKMRAREHAGPVRVLLMSGPQGFALWYDLYVLNGERSTI